MRRIAILLGLFSGSLDLFGQAGLHVDRSKLRIGEQLQVTVQVQPPAGFRWVNRESLWPDSMTALAVVRLPAYTGQTPGFEDTYTLAVFDTGAVRLPALPVILEGPSATDTFMTPEIWLEVAPVEPDSAGLHPLRDIRHEPFRPAYYLRYLPYLVALLLVAYLAYRIYRRRKKTAPMASPDLPSLSPEAWAAQRLDDLVKARLWQRGEVKEHYTQLTDIFRTYLERRHRIRAMEQTTEEIKRQLAGKHFQQAALEDIVRLLELADHVKFAKADPGADVHPQTIDRIREFIRAASIPIDIQNPPRDA